MLMISRVPHSLTATLAAVKPMVRHLPLPLLLVRFDCDPGGASVCRTISEHRIQVVPVILDCGNELQIGVYLHHTFRRALTVPALIGLPYIEDTLKFRNALLQFLDFLHLDGHRDISQVDLAGR
jgi:hypothetical protein